MSENNEIKLGVDALKKILEFLPQNYSVSIQINNTIFPAQTFDISDDYEEIVLKWVDLDYREDSHHITDVDDIKKIMSELQKENEQLKQEMRELKNDLGWKKMEYLCEEEK